MGFRYRPNDDEAAAAIVIARRRNRLNGGGSNLPGGETAGEHERLIQHYRAALAEIAVSRMLNLCWSGCGRGASGLRDVGGLLEVRSISAPNRGLLARSKDDDGSPCVLVLVTDDRWCEALGWEFFEVVKASGRVIDGNTKNQCWILPPTRLRHMAELSDVITSRPYRPRLQVA